MSYPAYIIWRENGDRTDIKPVYLDSKADVAYVTDALDTVNDILLTKGYQVKVTKQ